MLDIFRVHPPSPACDSEVKGVTSGCSVAGVQPGPPWNGTRLPREKEMEQEIGLVSLFPFLVSLSNPRNTHTDTHTPSAQANSGETWDFLYVCDCVFVFV